MVFKLVFIMVYIMNQHFSHHKNYSMGTIYGLGNMIWYSDVMFHAS